MSRADRYSLPSEQEFELVSDRCIVVPGVIWAAAMLVAILSALTLPDAGSQRAAAPVLTEAATVAYGA
jgi:hypothetical protein